MVSIHDLSEERIPSEQEQKAVDKRIKQLEDHAALNTVLQAKRIILQFVCHDYCQMTPKELDKLQTKHDLYTAAASWVCAQLTRKQLYCPFSNFMSGGRACLVYREICTGQEGQICYWRSSWEGHHGSHLGRHGAHPTSLLSDRCSE